MNIKLAIMKKRLKIQKSVIKLLIFVVLFSIFIFPDVFFHNLLILLHALFESIASLLEHMLMAVFGIDKFLGQLLLFYLGCSIGVYGLYRLWKKLPDTINQTKTHVFRQYLLLRTQVVKTWQQLSIHQKIKVLVIQFVAIITVFALTFS